MARGPIQTLGGYVRAQREAALLTVVDAAARAELSRAAWEKVEADRPVRPITVRKVAHALGLPPQRLLELAGLPYVETDDARLPGSVIDDLRRRVEALEQLPQQIGELRNQVKELVTTVRSVHHSTPGT